MFCIYLWNAAGAFLRPKDIHTLPTGSCISSSATTTLNRLALGSTHFLRRFICSVCFVYLLLKSHSCILTFWQVLQMALPRYGVAYWLGKECDIELDYQALVAWVLCVKVIEIFCFPLSYHLLNVCNLKQFFQSLPHFTHPCLC